MKRYEDMLQMPHHVSGRRAKMSEQDRAAQFAPFAALVGFENNIAEAERLTEAPVDLTETAREEVDQVLRQILHQLKAHPQVEVQFFRQDDRKSGGARIRWRGSVQKLDTYRGVLLLDCGREVPICDILTIFVIEDTSDV